MTSEQEEHLCRIDIRFNHGTHRSFIVNKWARDGLWHCSVHCSTQPNDTFLPGWNNYPGRKSPADAIHDVMKQILKDEEASDD